jgi:O-antigen/teichoic acid export membrane protein
LSLTVNSPNLGMLRDLFRRPLIRNASWLLGGQGAGLFFQAVYFIFLARLLGSTEYGVFAGAFAFTGLLAQYTPLGMGTVFLRYVSGQPAKVAPYFGNILLATSATSGLLIVGLTFSAGHLLNPASAHLVFFAAIANCLFAQMAQEIGRMFQAFEKMRITATLNLLVNGLRMLGVLALLLMMHHASAFQWAVVSTSVSGLAAVAAIGLAIANFGWPTLDFAVAKKHLMEGLGFSFACSTSAAYNDLDKTMLSHYGMNAATGIYSMAYRLVDFATMPIFAIRDAALPGLFRRGHEGITKSAEYGHRLLLRTLSLGILASLCLFLGAPIIPKLVGSGFSESVNALRWLAIIPVFRSIHQMSGIVLTSAGRQNVRTASQLTAACLNFALNLWLIPHFGWHGAAWASVATDGTLALLNWSALKVLVIRSTAHLEPSLT